MSWLSLDPRIRDIAHQALTPKQLNVLRDRTNGHTWNTIALAHNIDEATARGHHKRAIRKLATARKEQTT